MENKIATTNDLWMLMKTIINISNSQRKTYNRSKTRSLTINNNEDAIKAPTVKGTLWK